MYIDCFDNKFLYKAHSPHFFNTAQIEFVLTVDDYADALGYEIYLYAENYAHFFSVHYFICTS